ncbi:MAG TPA: type II toxin-antitoxin system RelE/ParE family toxin [Bryobacteraceae bacterium]
MPLEIAIRTTARREIKAHGVYLEEHAGPDVTERFLTAVQQSFETLARVPRAGVVCGFRKPALRRVRRWPVKGFENWLIFYIPKRNGVEIVHIIHGARDILGLLDV